MTHKIVQMNSTTDECGHVILNLDGYCKSSIYTFANNVEFCDPPNYVTGSDGIELGL